jgi:hypothetical protein
MPLATLTWKVKCLKSLIFCFRRREMEFALAHRRLRVQRLSQNAIDSSTAWFSFHSNKLRIYVRSSRLMPCLWYIFLNSTYTCTHAHNYQFQTSWVPISLRDHVHLWITFVFVSNTCVSLDRTKTSPEDNLGQFCVSHSRFLHAKCSYLYFMCYIVKFLLLKKMNPPVIIPRTGTFYKPLLTVKLILCCNLSIERTKSPLSIIFNSFEVQFISSIMPHICQYGPKQIINIKSHLGRKFPIVE